MLGIAKKNQTDFIFPWKQGVKLFVILLFLIGVLWFTKSLGEMRRFPIQKVKIFGIKNTDPQEMQHLLIPLVSQGFFGTDVSSIKERLMQLPWIAQASVRRVWPGQLNVILSERRAVANWNNRGLLSSSGEIFNPSIKTYPEGLPKLVGPSGMHIQMLDYYSKINKVLQPVHVKIARLELTSYQAWNMTFDNGIRVNAGYKDILTRMSHFVKVYPKIVGERASDVDYIDLRYENGLAIKWKSIT